MLLAIATTQCKKNDRGTEAPPAFRFIGMTVNGTNSGFTINNSNLRPEIKITFSDAVNNASISSAVSFVSNQSEAVAYNATVETNNSVLVISPVNDLKGFTKYSVKVSTSLQSANAQPLSEPIAISLQTALDSTDKFPRISDDALLDLVQQQTFKYFWDFAHPVSGLARERNTSGDVVTSGGSGFGIMSIVVAASRGFITRAEALTRMEKMVDFLKNTAQTFHGAYPHWLNGESGEVVPFSDKDDGADLVETSFLMQGLLTARQFFDGTSTGETNLRNDINAIWNGVEWDWFRKNDQDVLYWHWSPDFNWQMNFPIRGWNECLITYVLAASSNDHSIPKSVYDNGWAQMGAMANNSSYYGINLPLGPAFGGPLFFAHYSFLGLDPHDLSDAYANYWTQNTAHAMINYKYCVDNPKDYAGYSSAVWGLTASDDNNGYAAHAPDNDVGVISPTAALASFPYTPQQSMEALKFFYYKLGDRIWKDYGFVDAFNLNVPWFADSFLAIDQGPIIVMIENYRSGLLWDLFMSCPEVKNGLTKLGFQSPHL
jgi:hypothetical protein